MIGDQPQQRVFTPVECASLIGGVIGALLINASSESVAAALQWYLENREKWPTSPFDRAVFRLPAAQTRM
jgi:hypothetical protein